MAKEQVKTVPNAQVKVAKIKQMGDADFGIEEKELAYLLIITDKGTVRMNIGTARADELKEILG